MKAKICGITNKKDLKTCEANNADLIGFINIERSARFIKLDKIADLCASMEDKNNAVLVLENEDINEVKRAIDKTGVQKIQFHSLLPPEIRDFSNNNPTTKIIKAIGIPVKINNTKKEEIKRYSEICDFLLFDSEIQGKSGGTGKQIPLNLAVEAAETARNSNGEIELLLAGGMNIQRIKTEGKILNKIFDYVDVNSGVEKQPGYKSEEKIQEFMQVIK